MDDPFENIEKFDNKTRRTEYRLRAFAAYCTFGMNFSYLLEQNYSRSINLGVGVAVAQHISATCYDLTRTVIQLRVKKTRIQMDVATTCTPVQRKS